MATSRVGFHPLLACFFVYLFSSPGSCQISMFTSQSDQPSYSNVTAAFNTVYYRSATNALPVTFFYPSTTAATDGTHAVRVTVSSPAATDANPILIIVKRQRSVLSWQIPLILEETHRYSAVSRTLCPMDNCLTTEKSFRVLNGEPFYIEIITVSANPIRFSIRTDTFHEFYQQGTKSFLLQASPSAPQFVMYQMRPGVERVLVKLDSDVKTGGKLCGFLSIQSSRCPVLNLEADMRLDGRFQTVTTHGAIEISRSEFTNGTFYIAVLVKPEDSDCQDRQSWAAVLRMRSDDGPDVDPMFSHEPRIKTVNISVVDTLSQNGYILATLVPVSIFLVFFVITLILLQTGCRAWKSICCIDLKRTRLPTKEETWIVARFFEKSISCQTIPSMWDPANYKRSHIVSMMRKHGRASKETDLNKSLTVLNAEHAPPENPLETDESTTDLPGAAVRHVNLTSIVDLAEELGPRPTEGTLSLLRVRDLNKISSKQLTQTAREYGVTLMTVFLFYSLPVIQLVITHQGLLAVTGNQDICYYNFACSNRLGIISDFNHIISNIGYVLLGILFLVLVRRRAIFTAKLRQVVPDIDDFGIPSQLGLFYGMGLALVMEGFMSASYHICPSYNNFQFDTSFMYLISGLLILKLYHSRHPDILPRSYIAYMLFAAFIFIALVGVVSKHIGWWIAFSVIHGIVTLQVGLHLFFVGYLQLGYGTFVTSFTAFKCVGCRCPDIPWSRIFLAVVITLINLGFAIAGPILRPWDFATHLLFILQANLITYAGFYAVMKIKDSNERISRAACLYFLLAAPAWIVGMYYFTRELTDWSVSAAISRQGNRQCFLFEFYDEHDVWHMLSAFGLFFTFMMLLTLDDDLATISRAHIAVF